MSLLRILPWKKPAAWKDETRPVRCDPPQPFIYQPITPGKNIRILMLFGDDDPDSVLEMKIVEISLKKPPKYYAISYCWEGQSPSCDVLCGGKLLTVTLNCEAALRRFRRSSGRSVLLWIDAICIDQSPNQTLERNHQVAMMGDVYQRAEQVWVWLGSSQLDDLRPHYVRILEWFSEVAEAASDTDSERARRRVIQVAHNVDVNDLGYVFLEVSWFSRTWVVQEVALAKSSLLFRDEIVISAAGLCKAEYILETCSKSDKLLWPTWHDFEFFVRNFQTLQDLESGRADGVSIMELTRNLQCSDPKDKIFAIQRLLNEAGVVLPSIDYSRTIEQIFTEVAIAILRSQPRLTMRSFKFPMRARSKSQDIGQQVVLPQQYSRLLSLTHGLGNLRSLPSWVPDMSVRNCPLIPRLGQDRAYEAGRLHQTKAFFLDNMKKLIVQGLLFEPIASHASLAVAHTSEANGAAVDYFSWSTNKQPSDGKWRDMLNLYPSKSLDILVLWNVHVITSLVSFALDQNVRGASRDARYELYSCLRSRDGSYAEERIVRDIASWDQWIFTLMGIEGISAEQEETQAQEDIEADMISGAGSRLSWYLLGHQQRFLKSEFHQLLVNTPEFKVLQSLSEDDSQAEICETIFGTLHYQTMFKTQSGKLGVAPYSIRAGDQIVLFAGMDYPMVIRPQGDEYRLICPAYVHGIMHGEAWETLLKAGAELQDFVLV